MATDKNAKMNTPFLDHTVHGHNRYTTHFSSKSHFQEGTLHRAPCLRNSDPEVFVMRSTPLLAFPKQHIHFRSDGELRCSLHVQREVYHISVIPKSSHRKTHMDKWLSYLAWVYDYNFDVSLKYLKENDCVDKVIDRLDYKEKDTKEKMEYVREVIKKYIDDRLIR